VSQVVNDDGALQIGDRRISTVLLPYERSSTIGVHGVSFTSRIPEIDSSGGASVWRQDIALADKASDVLIFRGCAQEDLSCLVSRDRPWQQDCVDDYDHLDSRSGVEIELLTGKLLFKNSSKFAYSRLYLAPLKTAKIACIATMGTPSISRVPEA